MIRIAPSILSADFARLADEVRIVERGGATMIHVDVMDGHFAPNLTIGPAVVSSLRRATELPLDCHLMVDSPERYVEPFARAGADLISVHQEVGGHLHRTLQAIRDCGKKAGLVLNPATPVATLVDLIGDVDYVLLMSVNPGFSGQDFIPRTLVKLEALRQLMQEEGSQAAVEVDGGVGVDNAAEIVRRGADWLVAGAAVFGAEDSETAVRELRARAEHGLAARQEGRHGA
jgi:ribulose-phosphate 3-epimerase